MSGARTQDEDGIWIIDAQGKTAYVNERMAQILRTAAAELMGKDSFAYVFPADVSEAQRLFSLKSGGNSAPFRFRLRRADSTAVWVDVQGTPLFNAAGIFIGIVGTFTVASPQP